MSLCSVILCHHAGNFLPACIKSLKNSIGVKIEIIVVTSISKSQCPEFDVDKVIFCSEGPSQKRNVGASYAKGFYLFFLDDDTEVEPNFLLKMKEMMDKPDVGMVYGKTLNMERRTMLDNAGSYLTWTGFLWAREESGQVEDKGQFDTPEEIFAGKGAAMALRRDTFFKVKGFDPIYEILAEETDISWKVWFIGQKVIWVPEAVLFHAFNTVYKPWNYYYTRKRVYYNGCRNYILMLSKFLEFRNWIRIIPIQFGVWFFAGLGMLVTGKWEAGLYIWKGLLYHLNPVFIADTLRRRKEAQKLRTEPDSVLFEKIMRQPKFSFYWKRFLHYIRTGRHG